MAWWECTSSFVSRWVRPNASAGASAPHHLHGAGIGRGIRRHLRHYWGLSRPEARLVYGTLVTCVLVGAGGGAVAGGYLPGTYWPGAGGGFLTPIPGEEIGLEVPVAAVPEPSSMLVLAVGFGTLIVLRRKLRNGKAGRDGPAPQDPDGLVDQ